MSWPLNLRVKVATMKANLFGTLLGLIRLHRKKVFNLAVGFCYKSACENCTDNNNFLGDGPAGDDDGGGLGRDDYDGGAGVGGDCGGGDVVVMVVMIVVMVVLREVVMVAMMVVVVLVDDMLVVW